MSRGRDDWQRWRRVAEAETCGRGGDVWQRRSCGAEAETRSIEEDVNVYTEMKV